MAEGLLSFRVEKQVFVEAVNHASRSLQSNNVEPILRAITLTADQDDIICAGYDNEVSNEARLAAEIFQPGRIAVAGKLLDEITKNLPNQLVNCEVVQSQLKVTCGSSRFEIPLIPIDEYPPLPKMPEVIGTVDLKEFQQAVAQVSSAAASDSSDTLPMLTGMQVHFQGDTIKLTATDRFRLTVRTMKWSPSAADIDAKVLVPASKLVTVKYLDTAGGDPLELALGATDAEQRNLLFGLQYQGAKTTMRLLDGDYPNVDPLIPQMHESMAAVNISELAAACKRVGVVSSHNDPIRLSFGPEEVKVTANSSESGHAEEYVACEYTGTDQYDIAFNPDYLKNGLNVINTDRVVFGFTNSARPAIMVPEPEQLPSQNENGEYPRPDTDFVYLLMPVRLPG
ncbi:MAG: DNA polymerase III subunit beta [Corynebacterium sp.]|nr:DNA polymerase III subunit beta [Corynebacterium sp.]